MFDTTRLSHCVVLLHGRARAMVSPWARREARGQRPPRLRLRVAVLLTNTTRAHAEGFAWGWNAGRETTPEGLASLAPR